MKKEVWKRIVRNEGRSYRRTHSEETEYGYSRTKMDIRVPTRQESIQQDKDGNTRANETRKCTTGQRWKYVCQRDWKVHNRTKMEIRVPTRLGSVEQDKDGNTCANEIGKYTTGQRWKYACQRYRKVYT